MLAAGLAGRISEMYQYRVLKPPGRCRFTVTSYKIIIVNISLPWYNVVVVIIIVVVVT